jgi:hypothetical protein
MEQKEKAKGFNYGRKQSIREGKKQIAKQMVHLSLALN